MKSFFNFLCSLQLTIACLVLGLALVFFGTLAQTSLGIREATEMYFYSYFLYWSPAEMDIAIPYFPGGYTIGFVLLANLIAAHVRRFKLAWNKLGIHLTHLGLITLLIGELIASQFQVDSVMTLDEGSSADFSEDQRHVELAIIDKSASEETDRVYAVPESMLLNRQKIQHPDLPFTIDVNSYFENSALLNRDQRAPDSALQASQGIGRNVSAIEIPKTGKMDERNLPAMLITVYDKSNLIGTWLMRYGLPPQSITYHGKSYTLQLRPRRHYHPFEIKLIDFSHDRYLGTNIPKNFSSDVILTDPRSGERREFLIYMNNPLRHDGLTFYQYQFANNEMTSILQVVRNPGRHLPYLSLGLVFAGLLTQFGISLSRFVKRIRRKGAPV